MLVLDRDKCPLGWLDLETTSDDAMVRADQPVAVVTAAETLRDALSDLLATGARSGAVVDERGVFVGALPLETVAAVLAPPGLTDEARHAAGATSTARVAGNGHR